jgi:hypothetical protein
MKVEMKEMNKDKFESMTMEIITPDGVLYCTVCELDNKPVKIISTFGKAGHALASWANAVDLLFNLLFQKGLSINDIISELSTISSIKSTITPVSGVKVSSGPAGIFIALLEYKRQKFQEHNIRMLESGF